LAVIRERARTTASSVADRRNEKQTVLTALDTNSLQFLFSDSDIR